jgi:hypothetical protein
MTIENDLITAYRNAEYIVFADENIVMKIGKYSCKLERLMQKKACHQAAFITACNPYSKQLDDSTNNQAQAKLIADLHLQNFEFINGVGRDSIGIWPDEKSLLILNITKIQAEKLARKYQQNAMLWIDKDATPQLISTH